jgi:hypothetical protein
MFDLETIWKETQVLRRQADSSNSILELKKYYQ